MKTMREEEDSDKFKIRMDDDDEVPEEEVEAEEDLEEMPSRKSRKAEPDPMEKLSRRLTLTAVLLTALMTVLAVAGFYQLQKLLESSRMASTMAVSDMYKEVENQMNTLSETLAAVDAKIGTEIDGVKKSIDSLEGLKPALDRVKSSSISKKDHEKDLTDMANQVAGVKTLVDGFQVEMKTRNEALQKRVEALGATVSKYDQSIKALETRQTQLANEKISLATLREALQKQEDEFNLTNGQLRKEINSLRSELVRLLNQGPAAGPAPKSQPGAGLIEQTIE